MEAEEEKDEGRWKNIVEAVICIGFWEVCWHCGGHRPKLFGIWCWEEQRLLWEL